MDKPIKNIFQIELTPEEERTEDEKIRFARVNSLPKTLRDTMEEKAKDLLDDIMKLEAERDKILDFLNGFWEE